MTVGSILEKSGDGNQEPGTEIVLLGEFNAVAIQARPIDEYVNATAMCQATGKQWGHYWATQDAKDYAEALSLSIAIPIDRLVITKSGRPNRGGGTWVHRRVAIHLAQWCSPEFAVWVSGKLEELLTTGKTSIVREHTEATLTDIFSTQTKLLMAIHEEIVCLKDSSEKTRHDVAHVKGDVAEVKVEVAQVKDRMDYVEQAMLGKRKNFSPKNISLAREVIHREFRGLCQICRTTYITNEQGMRIRSTWEAHHWQEKGTGEPRHLFPCCKGCHLKFKQVHDFHEKYQNTFDFFQRVFQEYLNGPQSYPLWPSDSEDCTP